MSIDSKRTAKKSDYILKVIEKDKNRKYTKKIGVILSRPEEEHSEDDRTFLIDNKHLVIRYQKSIKQKILTVERKLEVEDDEEILLEKCKHLSKILLEADNIVVYTGAGISTSASIPDYRGSDGIWTRLQQGKTISLPHNSAPNIVDSQPTYTHMCLQTLHRIGKVKHVVSQNCDGLHLRSGLPREALSELHGNMFIEKCMPCQREYIRLFDVTENTAYRHHGTSRTCQHCAKPLTDTIVHFGEMSKYASPYNWDQALREVKKADVILCIGSSLKILKSYSCLWSKDKAPADRPKLCIINLQWTSKDNNALLKINAKCDQVMNIIMETLQIKINAYLRSNDPLFTLAVALTTEQMNHNKAQHLLLVKSEVKFDDTDNKDIIDKQDNKDHILEPIKQEKNSWFGKGLKTRKPYKRKKNVKT